MNPHVNCVDICLYCVVARFGGFGSHKVHVISCIYCGEIIDEFDIKYLHLFG